MNKYSNVRHNGFASKKEANRAAQLEVMQKLGLISELQIQVPFILIPKCDGQRECKYIADFTYMENGRLVVNDAKGFRTPEYKIKKKLMNWRFGIKILET